VIICLHRRLAWIAQLRSDTSENMSKHAADTNDTNASRSSFVVCGRPSIHRAIDESFAIKVICVPCAKVQVVTTACTDVTSDDN
jgi:hypothetical protein